jgi:predicted phosphodiesterase
MGAAVKQAAPRKRKPLPLLTPEYLPGLPIFTKRYFENLYNRLKTPFVIVFDNYHDVPIDSTFHEVIVHGHVHEAKAYKKGTTLVINPGEVCGYLTGKSSIAVLDIESKEARIIQLE